MSYELSVLNLLECVLLLELARMCSLTRSSFCPFSLSLSLSLSRARALSIPLSPPLASFSLPLFSQRLTQ